MSDTSLAGLNALLGQTGTAAGGSDQTTADGSYLGMTGTTGASFLGTVVVPYGSGAGWGGMSLGPFGMATPVRGTGTGGGVTVQDLFDWIQQLPPSQIQQVQADLANAGYYGKMDTMTNQPTWGALGSADRSALLGLFKDLVDNAHSGQPQSVESLLMSHEAQYATQQGSLSSLSPIFEPGHVYDVQHLDPSQAGDMIDQVALKGMGRTLDPAQRKQYADWLDQMYTQRQQQNNAGHQAVDQNNAYADAYAKALVDPATGRQLNENYVTATARQYLGIPYQWGGTDPSKGLDCSGLTQSVYQKLGVHIPRTSQEQWNQGGGTRFADPNMASPGDLVFFGNENGGPSHVGIYIGNGMMIDAPHTGARVRLDSISGFGSSMGLVGFEHFNQVGGLQMSGGISGPGGGPQGPGGLPDVGSQPDPGVQTAFSSGGGQPDPGVQTAFSSGTSDVRGVITSVAQDLAAQYGVDPGKLTEIALATAQQESNLNPSAVGDNGSSFGLYQLHQGGELGSLTQDQANDPRTNAEVAIRVMAQVLKDNPGLSPGEIAAKAQRPANPGAYADSVNAIVGGNGGVNITGTGPSSAAGPDGSTITSIDGRTLVTGQSATVNSVDASPAALQDAALARMRAEHPTEFAAQDFTNAYGMLQKALRDGITVNNA